jgi:4-amino-4-deoxy-L-arabinose transferase-like glycosyltransferase
MNRPTYYVIFCLIVIFTYHIIQNDIEKQFSLTYFGYNNIKRPLSDDTMYTYQDLGMPSGHAEISTIISCILYYYKFISLWLCILLIFIFSAQRVIRNRHEVNQVIVGIICGLIYSYIYISNNLSLLSFGIVMLIGLLLMKAIVYKNEEKKENVSNNIDADKSIVSYLYEIIQQ